MITTKAGMRKQADKQMVACKDGNFYEPSQLTKKERSGDSI